MLKEIIENTPLNVTMSNAEFKNTLTSEMFSLIYEKCGVNLIRDYESLTSEEIEKIVTSVSNIYKKIYENSILVPEQKIFITNSIMNILFNLWEKSYATELFFIKIRQQFQTAQIVSALFEYVSDFNKFQWVTNFFTIHKEIFPLKNTKIHTIGIYYPRIFSGGIERFISLIIPVYMQRGYRVILLTDTFVPELEYPTLPQSEQFQRVILKTPLSNSLQRLEEFETYIQRYGIDLLISHYPIQDFSPFVQILLCKLSGIKIIFQFHVNIKNILMYKFPQTLNYGMADAVVNLSRARMQFWKNLGVRSYYVPHPVMLTNESNFKGRNPKKVSNIIIWVGRISYQKGPLELVPIMKEVVSKIPNAKLKIIGRKDEEDCFFYLKRSIKINNLESNIEFCGFHTEVGKFYEEADLMLNTSPDEGWSLVIAESKFYELPLVLYELEDNELTRDGKGYIAVPQRDYHAAAQAVIKILTEEKFRIKMSLQARESIQPFLDYDTGGAWQRIFEDLNNNENIPLPNPENEQIQKILLKENFALMQRINHLIAQIKNK